MSLGTVYLPRRHCSKLIRYASNRSLGGLARIPARLRPSGNSRRACEHVRPRSATGARSRESDDRNDFQAKRSAGFGERSSLGGLGARVPLPLFRLTRSRKVHLITVTRLATEFHLLGCCNCTIVM